MILYVNGNNFTSAAEAVNQYNYAQDDPALVHLGKIPHPENLAVSWGKLLSLSLNAAFQCGAVADYTNEEIIISTRKWLTTQPDTNKLIIIQCAAWRDKLMEQYNMFMFHKELTAKNVPHIFFNGENSLHGVHVHEAWGLSFISPYDNDYTFTGVASSAGLETVMPNSSNFGRDAHSIWHRFILNYIITNKII